MAEFMRVKKEDLVSHLTEDENKFIQHIHVKFNDMKSWLFLLRIQDKVEQLIKDGVVDVVVYEPINLGMNYYVQSDYINGAGGYIQSQADGKIYDSKSAYYKSVKEAGCVVLGDDAPREAKKKDYNPDISKEFRQALQQHL